MGVISWSDFLRLYGEGARITGGPPRVDVFIEDILPRFNQYMWGRLGAGKRRRAAAAREADRAAGVVDEADEDELPLLSFDVDPERDEQLRAMDHPSILEIAHAIFAPYVEFFASAASTKLVILVADHRSRVSGLKKGVQNARRAAAAGRIDPDTGRPMQPYPPGTRLRSEYDADGYIRATLCVPPANGNPAEETTEFDVLRMYQTSGHALYNDFVEFLEMFAVSREVVWPENVQLVLDFRDSEPPLLARGVSIRPSGVCPIVDSLLAKYPVASEELRPRGSALCLYRLCGSSYVYWRDGPHTCGEGDFAVVKWAEFAADATTRAGDAKVVCIHTKDGDSCVLAVYRWMVRAELGSAIGCPIVWQGSPSGTWDIGKLARLFAGQGWTSTSVVMAALLSGCDHLDKSLFTNQVGRPCIWEALRRYRNDRMPGTPEYLDYALRLVYALHVFGVGPPSGEEGGEDGRRVKRCLLRLVRHEEEFSNAAAAVEPPKWMTIVQKDAPCHPERKECANVVRPTRGKTKRRPFVPLILSIGPPPEHIEQFCRAWKYWTTLGMDDLIDDRARDRLLRMVEERRCITDAARTVVAAAAVPAVAAPAAPASDVTTQLTRGTIQRIYRHDETMRGAILQVIGIKKTPGSPTNSDRYHLMLSDGKHCQQFVLATTQNHFIESAKLRQYTIIRLHDYACNVVAERRIVLVLGLDVVGEATQQIGAPVNVDPAMQNAPRAPAAAPTAQPVAIKTQQHREDEDDDPHGWLD